MESTVARNESQPERAAHEPRRPVRTCVACRGEGTRGELFRLVQGPDGTLAFDTRARMPGRGAWVHPTRKCLTEAVKRHAPERAIGVGAANAEAMIAGVRAALTRKVESLVLTAARKRVVGVGAAASAEALERGHVPLVVLAKDAGDVRRAARGDGVNVREFGSRESWGRVFGRGEVAIFAVTDAGIATEISTTVDCLAGLEDG